MNKKTFGTVAFAVIIEAIITYADQFLVNGDFSWKMAVSVFLGITVSIAYKLDLPEYFNLTSKIPYVGCVLTGILLSRGSNYIFDLLNDLSSL